MKEEIFAVLQRGKQIVEVIIQDQSQGSGLYHGYPVICHLTGFGKQERQIESMAPQRKSESEQYAKGIIATLEWLGYKRVGGKWFDGGSSQKKTRRRSNKQNISNKMRAEIFFEMPDNPIVGDEPLYKRSENKN